MTAELDTATPERDPRPRTRRRRRARFEIGRVLGNGLSIWLGGLPAFVALTALVFAPYVLLVWWLERAGASSSESWLEGIEFVLLEQLLSLVVSATVIYAVFQRLRGRRVGMVESIGYGLARLPAVVGASVLIGCVFVLIFLPVFMAALTGSEVALVLFLLPATVVSAIVYCGLWVVIPVCVVERPGMVQSLRRSWALTKGSKGAIFVVLLLFGVIGLMLGALVTLVVTAVFSERMFWFDVALTIVVTSMTAVVTAVGYHELRQRVDGVDADELAAIFD